MPSNLSPGNAAEYNEDNELQVNPSDNLLFKSADYPGAQANTVLIPGVAGKHIEVHGFYISSSNNVGATSIDFATSGIIVGKMYHAAQNKGQNADLHADGAVAEDLEITCPAGTFIAVTYHIHN